MWTDTATAWLPSGAWHACTGEVELEEGEQLWLGVDIGGSRAASAIVGVTADLRVAIIETYDGDESVLKVAERLRALASSHSIAEVVYAPGASRRRRSSSSATG